MALALAKAIVIDGKFDRILPTPEDLGAFDLAVGGQLRVNRLFAVGHAFVPTAVSLDLHRASGRTLRLNENHIRSVRPDRLFEGRVP
jgi:hypothetical protein